MADQIEKKVPDSSSATTLVSVYVKMRDDLATEEEKFKEFKAKRKEQMQKVADGIQKLMDDSGGIESLKTKAGTAFHKLTDFVSVQDWNAVLEHVVREAVADLQMGQEEVDTVVGVLLESGALSIFNKSVSKTVVKEYMGDHNGATPAGLEYGTKIEIQVRKPTK